MVQNSGTEKQLASLHKKLALTMLKAIDASDVALDLLGRHPDLPKPVQKFLKDQCQINPALLQAVSKFLKDNDITCPQDESSDLDSLATRLKNKSKHSVNNVTHIDP